MFLNVLNSYFRGEKLEALFFILPIGLALVAFGVAMLQGERTAYAWGSAIPAFVFGLVLIVTGAVVGSRTTAQVAELTQGFTQAPEETVQKELPRMQKVNANFRATLMGFGVLVVVGLLLLYAVRAEWAQGLGSALILGAAVGLVIDGVASRRALPYTAALEELARTPK